MEEAMRRCREKFEFDIRWRPFLLRPNVPLGGQPKAPGTVPPQAKFDRMAAAGRAVGLNFIFNTERIPNTVAAHALLEYAANVDGGEKQDALLESIFKAFFCDEIYPDATNLSKIAKEHGFDEQEVYNLMSDEENLEKAAAEAYKWRSKRVSVIPFFFMNGEAAFAGAQDPEAFVNMFETIAKKYPITS